MRARVYFITLQDSPFARAFQAGQGREVVGAVEVRVQPGQPGGHLGGSTGGRGAGAQLQRGTMVGRAGASVQAWETNNVNSVNGTE